ncbi:hypothetical protein ABZ215_40145, partial [Amycolatopsis sp. NPDC006131]|uniref:hypothetical protein n=1 Tax=Amycolatopsis sp. NPDC006131 TaxID=3156731 RepID=UPI0033BA3C74
STRSVSLIDSFVDSDAEMSPRFDELAPVPAADPGRAGPLQLLVRVFGRLPDPVSRGFARVLDAGTVPFDVVNCLGSCGGGLLPPRWMAWWFDRIIASLHRRLDRASDADLGRGMHYPIRWDPFFAPYMTLADVYRYPARHFAFHQRQLTLIA